MLVDPNDVHGLGLCEAVPTIAFARRRRPAAVGCDGVPARTRAPARAATHAAYRRLTAGAIASLGVRLFHSSRSRAPRPPR